MKKKVFGKIVLALCLLSLAGIAFVVIRDMMRTPADYMNLAREQIKDKNYRTGVVYLLRASKGGMAEADYQLALLYNAGDKIPENRPKAVEHMRRAADRGLASAQYALAVWTEQGYFGEVNEVAAIRLYEQAANQGHKNAMKSLIVRYAGIDGVSADKERQNYWMRKLNQKGK